MRLATGILQGEVDMLSPRVDFLESFLTHFVDLLNWILATAICQQIVEQEFS